MSQAVVGDLKLLKNITTEMKRLKAQLKLLSLQKQEAEDRVKEYLEKEQQVGVKYDNIIIMSKESTQREKLKKNEKLERGINVLENAGVLQPKEVLTNVLESMKGDKIAVTKIQMKESKQDE